jgi:homotetrameric cytidine deaminase
MNPAQLIARKRDGMALSPEEIGELVRGFVGGTVADCQMSAWAMAVCLRGMSDDETVALTQAMLDSGKVLDADDVALRVDKHSTGGVGDKSSLIVAPLLACCGLRVPMISGRGLGPTGGTLDKLESIPGIRTDLSVAEIRDLLATVGCVITGATAELVPADRRLYALRDVTGTVSSIPLIAASIMSKKLAERLSALVLDVKYGSGALMKSRWQARALAEALVKLATNLGLPTTALITSMHQPTGRMVGNAVEVDEALEILAGHGPADLRDLTLALAGEVLLMKSLAKDAAAARSQLVDILDSGRALQKFAQMVAAQGGDLDAARPRAPAWTLTAPRNGYVTAIDAEQLGLAMIEMGGGRKQASDAVDRSVGLEMLVRLGDPVHQGQPLLNLFASTVARSRGLRALESCMVLGDEPPVRVPLIAERIVPAAAAHPGQELPGEPPAAPLAGPAHLRVDQGMTLHVDARLRQELIDQALAARRRAYAPYSGFHVGAALLAESGRIYRGGNVENASYGLTICAERAAFVTALASGESQFAMLAIASPGGAAPCGACLQFAAEFCRELPVLLIDPERAAEPVERRLSELLPARFCLAGPTSDQHAGHAGRHEASQRTPEHRP